jgi:hypothetical protein
MNRMNISSVRCKRCNKPAGIDQICQECKSELLSNYEASSDWHTAFEIERASQTALRYHIEERGDNDLFTESIDNYV